MEMLNRHAQKDDSVSTQSITRCHGILDPYRSNIGDSIVLYDPDGRTVDSISYTITELDSITQTKEAATGTGGLRGSTFLGS